VVLVPVIVASVTAYRISDAAIATKLVPIVLTLLALAAIMVDRWRPLVDRGPWRRSVDADSPDARSSSVALE
jgi:hypothetical protein